MRFAIGMARLAGFEVQYISHVCFRFMSPGGAAIITDPFFAAGFQSQGRWEKCLSQPAFAAGAFRRCDAVFISHIHGDHFDPDAVEAIARNCDAEVWAPPNVIAALRLRAYSGYDGSFRPIVGRCSGLWLERLAYDLEAELQGFMSDHCLDPHPFGSGAQIQFHGQGPVDRRAKSAIFLNNAARYFLIANGIIGKDW